MFNILTTLIFFTVYRVEKCMLKFFKFEMFGFLLCSCVKKFMLKMLPSIRVLKILYNTDFVYKFVYSFVCWSIFYGLKHICICLVSWSSYSLIFLHSSKMFVQPVSLYFQQFFHNYFKNTKASRLLHTAIR